MGFKKRRWSRYEAKTISSKLNCPTMLDNEFIMQMKKAIQKTSHWHHDEIRTRLSVKWNRLHTRSTTKEKQWLHNLSDRQLTTTEVNLLECGLNFNTSNATVVDLIAALEPVPPNKETKNDYGHNSPQHSATRNVDCSEHLMSRRRYEVSARTNPSS